MPPYICECCNFSSKLKSDYSRHLNTKKHKKNMLFYEGDIGKLCKKPSKFTPNLLQNPPKILQNSSKILQNPSETEFYM